MIPPSTFDISLSEIFDRYRGTPVVLQQGTDAAGQRELQAREEQNPVLTDIRTVAESIGLQVRVWTPTTIGNKSFFKNRINVTLEKTDGPDNKPAWHIGKIGDDSGRAVAVIEKSAATRDLLIALEEARKPPPPPPPPSVETAQDVQLLSLPAIIRRRAPSV